MTFRNALALKETLRFWGSLTSVVSVLGAILSPYQKGQGRMVFPKIQGKVTYTHFPFLLSTHATKRGSEEIGVDVFLIYFADD